MEPPKTPTFGTSDDYLARLLARLRDELGPTYTWEEGVDAAQSFYDDWLVRGSVAVDSFFDSVTTSSGSKPASPQHSPRVSTTSHSSATSHVSQSPLDDGTRHVVARISKHVLRLDRQYQLARAKVTDADPTGRRHLRALQLRRLPSHGPDEPPLAVTILGDGGTNALPSLVCCGPSQHRAPRKIKQPPELRVFLNFAIGAAECLEMLHQGATIVHGEIRGDTFHYNAATNQVKLISLGSGVRSFENGLSSAGWSMLSQQYGVEHKLQFIAPEQTGRLPAAADSRTDLYSLGILFWAMLTGELPFAGSGPLEIMQKVLSQRIPAVSAKRSSVPDAISAIVSKLVHKNITSRYFSAAGLRWDLHEVQRLLDDCDCAGLAAFQVATKDVNSFFTLPNEQIGRDKEREAILRVIQRTVRSLKRPSPLKRTRTLSPLGSNESWSEGRPDILDVGMQRTDSLSSASSRQSISSNAAPPAIPLQPVSGNAAPASFSSSKDGGASPKTLQGLALKLVPTHDKRLSGDVASTSWDSDGGVGGRNSSFSSVPEGQVAIFRHASRLKRRDGRSSIVTISGAAGMGKSSLVHSIQAPSRQLGYFASAKFDQATKTPFEPVLSVLSSTFRQIFSESDVNTDFHQHFRAFVRPSWSLLATMLDLPTWLLDSSAAQKLPERVPSLGKTRKPSIHVDSPSHCGQAGHSLDDFLRTRASSKSSRLTATVLDVLRYLCAHKLVVFSLDDIQWADEASTDLIQAIVAARIELVLLLTRRTREALPAKMATLLSEPQHPASVTRIELRPLGEEDVARFVSATLHREVQHIFPLVAVVQEKTNGNPFFMRECLDACHRRGCIWYSWRDRAWTYDLDRIFAEFASEHYGAQINNDFIVARLLDLAPGARQLVAWAALVGATFSFSLIKALLMSEEGPGTAGGDGSSRSNNVIKRSSSKSGNEAGSRRNTSSSVSSSASSSTTTTITTLTPTIPTTTTATTLPIITATHRKGGLIRQSSQDAVKALQGAINAYVVVPTDNDDMFRFCHDRYQTAALALPEAHNTHRMHFGIANAMLHHPESYSAYTVAAHIVLAADAVRSRASVRSGYRDILYQAGEQATESGGRLAGLTYFVTALSLLQDEPWDETRPDVSYAETLVLHHRTAECYYLRGEMDRAVQLAQVVLDHSRLDVDKAPAWILQSRIAGRRGDHKPAFEILRICLGHLGLSVGETSWQACDAKFKVLAERMKRVDKRLLLDREPGVYCNADGSAYVADWSAPERLGQVVSDSTSEDYRILAAAGAVLCEAIGAAFWSNSLLFYQLTLLELEINLERGLVPQAGLAYIHFATVSIGRCGLVEFGLEMGDVALAHLDRTYSDVYTRGRGHTLYSVMVGPYATPLRQLLPAQEQALELCLSSGDRWSALLNIGSLASAKLWCSHDLAEIENFCTYGAEEIANWEHDVRGGTFVVAVSQFARALQGKTRSHSPDTILDDAAHTRDAYFELVERKTGAGERSRAVYDAYRQWANLLFGHWEAAIALGEALLPALGRQWSNRMVAMVPLHTSLARFALAREALGNSDEIEETLRQAKEHHARLVAWSVVSDANFAAWKHLLAAEIAEFECRYDASLAGYEAALDHAELHGLVLELALTFELYGEFLVRRGSKRSARSAVQEAISAYRRVSAAGKAQALAAKHEWLLRGTTSLHATDAATQTDLMPSLGQVAADRTSAWIQPDSNDIDVAGSRGDGGGGGGSKGVAGSSSSSGDDRTNTNQRKNLKQEFVEGTGGLDMIDLTSILRSSQALASELDADRLFPALTKIILESTAADLCAIIVEEDTRWVPAAITDQTGAEFARGQTLEHVEDLVGRQITLYALRFRELVFINNIYDDVRFSNVSEAYRARCPLGKAVVAMPIVRGEHLLGCLYVEGPPDSFTERNITVLRMLVSSIAISISNALLFKKSARLRANNEVMIEAQKHSLTQARQTEAKAKAAESEARRSLHLAEEAAKAKSLFLANISHELRTPLNGVLGMSELLKETTLNKEQVGYADSIRVCADTLLTVINDILDFSKLEAGKMQLFSVPLSLTETINEVVRALSFSNQEKDLQTIVELDLDDQLLVVGDPVRLHQVFMNLLSNAYKFTSAGRVVVKAVRDAETDAELRVTFSVEDTGIGISPEQKKKLFQPFSQADSSTARSYGGTGLGLSICRAILENVLKGKIWLDSELGRGTKVSFRLTFAKAAKGSVQRGDSRVRTRTADPMAMYSPSEQQNEHQDQQRKRALLDGGGLAEVPRQSIRICIAEDNPVNQRIAVQFVKKLGFNCEAYDDGRQAVDGIIEAKRRGNPFHIVLMDVQMPQLDGYNATREIRRNSEPDISSVLIIAMTASAIRGDREKCLEAGMNNYLAKPVRQQVLKQMLEGYLTHDHDEIPLADRSRDNTPRPTDAQTSKTPRPTDAQTDKTPKVASIALSDVETGAPDHNGRGKMVDGVSPAP